MQIADARNVDSPFGTNGNGRINSTAEYASLAWSGENTRLQGNVLASTANDSVDSINAVGLWLDGATLWNGYTHNYGIYRLEPGLTWGYQPVNNDIQGVYYRLAYQSLRWQIDGGIDRVTSVSGRGVNGTYATANGHYQLTTTLGLGGNGTYLHGGNQDSWTGSAFADYFWSMGSSRVEVSAAANNNIVDSRASQIALSHTWNMPAGSRLSTSVAATRDTTQAVAPGRAGRRTGRHDVPPAGIGRAGWRRPDQQPFGGRQSPVQRAEAWSVGQRRVRQRGPQLADRFPLVPIRNVLRQPRRHGEAVHARSVDPGRQCGARPAQPRGPADTAL